MTNETKGFFLYVRKSTDEPDRQTRSIDDQLAEMRQVADERRITILDVLVEKQSAKHAGRPVFNRMLERVERGEATGILAWHPDRLARNSLDGGRLIHLLDVGTITEIGFHDSWVDPTSQGKFMLAIAFGLSKYHSDSFGDGIRRVQRRKIQDGLWPQRPPLGYRFDPETRGIAPDPERAPLVRRAFQLYASGGYTLVRLRDAVNALGLTNRPRRDGGGAGPLSLSQYQNMLTNPIYYGVMRFNDELFVGKHVPIVPKRLYDMAQEILACRSKPNVRGAVSSQYRGMFRCGECGASITSEVQKGHEYLRCTKKLRPCSQRYVRVEDVTRQIGDLIHALAIPDDAADAMLRELALEHKQLIRVRAETLARARENVASIDAQLERLMGLYLGQIISLEEYRQQKGHLVGRRRELDDHLTEVQTAGSSWLEPATAFIQAAKATVLGEKTRTDAQKREFLRNAGSNLTIKDRTVQLVPRGPWKTVVVRARSGVGAAGAPPAAAPGGEPDRNHSMCPSLIEVRTFFGDAPRPSGVL